MVTPDPRVNVPEKYFGKWLQREFRLAELQEWIGLIKYVIAVGLVVYLSKKPPETWNDLLRIIGVIGSATGLWAGIAAVRNYKRRNRRDDN